MHKKYVKTFLFVMGAFVAVNAAIWFSSVSRILERDPSAYVGDLARMAYLPELAHPRPNTSDLPRKHLKFSEYTGQICQVVTIGDSFSYGMGFGPNRFYQDHIASKTGFEVLNLPPLTSLKDILQDIVILANSGYLGKLGVKYLVLEFAERNFLTRANADIDFSATMPLEEIDNIFMENIKNPAFSDVLPDIKIINTGNFKYLVNKSGFLFSDKAIFGDVLKMKLDRNMFNHQNGDILLCLEKDIRKSKYAAPENLFKINENLNQVSTVLENKDIKLVLLIAPNKYSAYSKYIVDNKYKPSIFHDNFSVLQKKYAYLDLYPLFERYLDSGGMDLYYIDDTHWSYHASSIVAESFDRLLHR